jgi:hypothetical protein
MKPKYGPKCPNHGCPLDGIGFPMPSKGTGICPVSGAPFDFEVEVDETTVRKDKDGNQVKDVGWNINGND